LITGLKFINIRMEILQEYPHSKNGNALEKEVHIAGYLE
jgi:hypothetical protein